MRDCRLFLFLFLPSTAYAYIDPASGSMLVSVLVAMVATAFFSIKGLYYRIKNFLRLPIREQTVKYTHKLVFYSEGGQYWHTFKPVLESLHKKGIEAIYLTSSEDDDGLNFKSNHISTRYIGSGTRAYIYLNKLEADVCAMTTPGLDVLKIKRSKGVKHYSYLPHSPIDMGKYKLYSFDCFDSIFISGIHQEKSIRMLETLRSSHTKQIFKGGCPYMDELSVRLRSFKITDSCHKKQFNTVLIAPTWGKNNILRLFEAKFIKVLLDQDFEVIIRPHPQSYKEEPELIQKLKKELISYKRLNWDDAVDNFESLRRADILVSGLSGVIFDFAFIFEKPVITIDYKYDFLGQEANDLPFEIWELGMVDKIGTRLEAERICDIANIVKVLLKAKHEKQEVRKLRAHNLLNYGNSGEVIANSLVEIMAALEK